VLITSASGTHSELSAHSNNSTPHNIPAPIIDSFHGVITDFVSAVTDNRPPAVSGIDGQRILEATLAAYVSAATGQTINLPLGPDDPVYQAGVLGIGDLKLAEWSPVGQRSLYRKAQADTP
ncbi:MAG TPA: hypothetical protein VGI74_17860, partial [Streptosporangiaceae bacterium]